MLQFFPTEGECLRRDTQPIEQAATLVSGENVVRSAVAVMLILGLHARGATLKSNSGRIKKD